MVKRNKGKMDILDKKLLNIIQSNFPLVIRPFLNLSKELGVSEEEIIERIKKLKSQKIIRQISAIFDSKKLGYQTALVGMKIKPRFLDQAAEMVSRHPGVSHNYTRNHSYNLWFTMALPPHSSMDRTIKRLGKIVRGEDILLLPAIRLFKIGVRLDMMLNKKPNLLYEELSKEYYKDNKDGKRTNFSDLEIRLIREFQEDIPLEKRPFLFIADRLAIDEKEIIKEARNFKKRGIMKRFAAVLNQRKAGFKSNMMVAWKVPSKKIVAIGKEMASFKAVSHCYQRPVFPSWPFSIYTMVHGRSQKECEAIVKLISKKTGIEEYLSLISVKEYKKVRPRYFTDELDKREEQNIFSD